MLWKVLMKKKSRFHPHALTPGERKPPWRNSLALAAAVCLVAMGTPASSAPPVRVGTSGDYAPFSVLEDKHEGPVVYQGLAPTLARAFARDRGLEIEFVLFRWPELLEDLDAGRFDVAMSGVTVRPERSLRGRFSLPITTSGAMVLVPDASPFVTIEELDEKQFQIAVNGGGHLERVSQKHFAKARILPMSENQKVIQALAEGRVDAAITDTREAPLWQNQFPGLRSIGPFTRDRKAFLVRADNPELARDLDAWLLEAEQSGQLETLRIQELGKSTHPTSTTRPLRALLAAVDERLSLMPWVAEAKRRTGGPIEVPEVETRVLSDAIARYRIAMAQDPESLPAKEEAVLDFYRAQIEAAKSIQRQTLAHPAADARVAPDLNTELRPALVRINDRIATLLVALPEEIDPDEVLQASREELVSTDLTPPMQSAITEALIALTSSKPPPNR
jgi:cyclohexadienyl dehydratase